MILYHLKSGFIDAEECRMVHPYIPHSRLENEDGTQKRICVSSSLDGCITALGIVPLITYRLKMLMNSQGEKASKKTLLNALTLPFTVLEFEVEKDADCFLSTAQIAPYVPDAIVTEESWLTKPMAPRNVSHLWLVDGHVSRVNIWYNGEECYELTIKGSKWSDTYMPLNKNFLDTLYTEVMDFLMYDSVFDSEYRIKNILLGQSQRQS